MMQRSHSLLALVTFRQLHRHIQLATIYFKTISTFRHLTIPPGACCGFSHSKPDATHELLRPTLWKDIAGGDLMFYQAQGWNWEGQIDAQTNRWQSPLHR